MGNTFDPNSSYEKPKPGAKKATPGSSKNAPTYVDNQGVRHAIKAPAQLTLDDPDARVLKRTVPTMGAGGKMHNHTIGWLIDQPAVKGYDVRGLQAQLVDAGILGKTYVAGVYDAATRKAYLYALSIASLQQSSYADTLKLIKASPVGAAGAGSTRAPFSYQGPTDEEVRLAIDKTVPSLIGRSLSDDETATVVRDFQAQLLSAARSRYNVEGSGGVAQPQPDLEAFATERAKALHPDEADTFKKFSLVNDTMRLLGIGAKGTYG